MTNPNIETPLETVYAVYIGIDWADKRHAIALQAATEGKIEGRAYVANRYCYWSMGGNRSSGTQIYRPGDSLTIYHHRQRPEIAVVERVRASVFVWMIALFSLLIAVRGMVMVKTGTASG